MAPTNPGPYTWGTQAIDQLFGIPIHRLDASIRQYVDERWMRDAELSRWEDRFLERMVYELRAGIMAEHVGGVTLPIYLTWWDHWKADHPRLSATWSKYVWRLRPPQYKRTATIDTWATYPENRFPSQERPEEIFGPIVFKRTIKERPV